MRELYEAAIEKQKLQWDHTAEMIAKMATIHCQGTYHASNFHPMRQPDPVFANDDPGAEYDRLIKAQQ